MHKLSYNLSPALLTLQDSTGSTTYHPFPSPHQWPDASEPLLRELGFGYRAGFLESSLATLRTEFGSTPGAVESGLESWRHMPLAIVRDKLISLKGVGRKVADCVMLMCLDQVSVGQDSLTLAISDPSRHPCGRDSREAPGLPLKITQQTHVQAHIRGNPDIPSGEVGADGWMDPSGHVRCRSACQAGYRRCEKASKGGSETGPRSGRRTGDGQD
jgi:hypothetical protein